MSTPVQDIYKIFLSQIGEDIITELERDVMEDLLLTYLEGSTIEFAECKKDLNISQGYISDDLDKNEKFILAKGMILYWLQPKLLREDTLKVALTDGDYNKKSTANLLDKLIKLKNVTEMELRKMKIRYSYRNK